MTTKEIHEYFKSVYPELNWAHIEDISVEDIHAALGYYVRMKVQGYIVGFSITGEMFIECPVCKLKSFNPNDIKYKYCGNCSTFHNDRKRKL